MARELRVLLIDDNNDDITLIRLAAKSAGGGHAICSVNRAKEAVELLEHKVLKDLPDILLVDLRMPDMDGFQFLRWLQQHPRLQVPAVVLSESLLDEDIAAAHRLGARGFLRKPVAYDDLLRTLKEFFNFWSKCELPSRMRNPSSPDA